MQGLYPDLMPDGPTSPGYDAAAEKAEPVAR